MYDLLVRPTQTLTEPAHLLDGLVGMQVGLHCQVADCPCRSMRCPISCARGQLKRIVLKLMLETAGLQLQLLSEDFIWHDITA
jgi:hypothetical protein